MELQRRNQADDAIGNENCGLGQCMHGVKFSAGKLIEATRRPHDNPFSRETRECFGSNALGHEIPQPEHASAFEEIKRTVTQMVLVDCDHHNLNDLMENPTAENLVVWMWERLEKHIPGLRELQLWETPDYCVTYRKPVLSSVEGPVHGGVQG